VTKPDSMLVDPRMIAAATAALAKHGTYAMLEDLAKREPALGQFVSNSATIIAGKMGLSGAPTEVVRGVHEEVISLVITCLGAVRQGTYEVWKGSEVGASVVAALGEPKRKRSRRRKNTATDEMH
jgi:hypothetical protein